MKSYELKISQVVRFVSRLSANLCSVNKARDVRIWLCLFFSLYTAIRPLGHSRQVYIVHSGLQDEGLQVTISNYRRVLQPAQGVCRVGAPVNVPIRRMAHSLFSCHACK